MIARSPHEAHRTATPLELFFDLVFVVAIAQAASGLHHAVAELHALDGLIGYLMVFFAIWWAWMAFTWFASAYDCDDVPYRLLVFVQIAGALSSQPVSRRCSKRERPTSRRSVATWSCGSRWSCSGFAQATSDPDAGRSAAVRGRYRGAPNRMGRHAFHAAGLVAGVPHPGCLDLSCRCGRSKPRRRRGIRITSPSDTVCSR